MADDKQLIYEAAPAQLERWLEDHDQPSYRLKQLLDWLYTRFAASFDDMTNLPAAMRAALAEDFVLGALREVARRESQDGMTVKFAYRLQDGAIIESVLMGSDKRSTFCISSQVGCAMGCTFCATGKLGLQRNLSAGEILEQVAALARADGDEAGNVVFMGMGEPLANLGNVTAALEALTDERRFAIGTRRITVSTVGLPDQIRALSQLPGPPNLALSLNSPFARPRAEIMPVAGRERLDDIIEAIINLIPYNPVEGAPHDKPSPEEIERFREVLVSAGMNVTQRYRRGRDIDAACGQLAGKTGQPEQGE